MEMKPIFIPSESDVTFSHLTGSKSSPLSLIPDVFNPVDIHCFITTSQWRL